MSNQEAPLKKKILCLIHFGEVGHVKNFSAPFIPFNLVLYTYKDKNTIQKHSNKESSDHLELIIMQKSQKDRKKTLFKQIGKNVENVFSFFKILSYIVLNITELNCS